MKTYHVTIDGALLKRGFWLYVCSITCAGKELLYVGRTGDSSSINAASMFSRLSRQLQLGDKAKSNSLVKNLIDQKLDPAQCSFKFSAFGPLAPECADAAAHKKQRDISATLEKELADHLEARGYKILGNHATPKAPANDEMLKANLFKLVDKQFPKVAK